MAGTLALSREMVEYEFPFESFAQNVIIERLSQVPVQVVQHPTSDTAPPQSSPPGEGIDVEALSQRIGVEAFNFAQLLTRYEAGEIEERDLYLGLSQYAPTIQLHDWAKARIAQSTRFNTPSQPKVTYTPPPSSLRDEPPDPDGEEIEEQEEGSVDDLLRSLQVDLSSPDAAAYAAIKCPHGVPAVDCEEDSCDASTIMAQFSCPHGVVAAPGQIRECQMCDEDRQDGQVR